MERESLEMDVVFIGAGPANLSGALHLARLAAEHNEAVASEKREGKSLGEIQIAVIEKGSSVGAHIVSGAVMDPRGLAELMPDFIEQGAPLESPVKEDHFLYLTRKRAIRSPITPPPLKNHGYYIVSLIVSQPGWERNANKPASISFRSFPALRCCTTEKIAWSACVLVTRV